MTWLTGWANRRKITVDGTKVTGNLSDFPVMLVLSSGTGINAEDVTDVFDDLSDAYFSSNATWNPDDKGANITLTNGNLTATRTTSSVWQAARGKTSKSSGKWYWEFAVTGGGDAYDILGIGTSSENLTYPGSSTNGYGYQGLNARKYYNASYSSYGATWGIGDTIGVALDLDNGKIWWSKNGTWQESGDPALGANPAFTGVFGTFYPMAGMYTATNQITANFGATSFTYAPPAGFTAFATEYTDNSKKIAVTTSGGDQCYVEIESWDWINEISYLWVKVPTLSLGVDTELYLYYDVSHADNTSYVGDTASIVATNVWDSNFMGVWHMNKPPTGSDAVKDSTSNARHMTSNGMTAANISNGEVGKKIYFDGSGDYLTRAAPTIPGSWTCEGWVKPTAVSAYDVIVTMTGDGLAMEGTPLSWCVLTGNSSYAISHAVVAGAYIYIVGVKDASNWYIYEDGVEYHTSRSNPGWGMSNWNIGGPGYSSNYFYGYMDEVRVSNIARSQAWVRANYYSMKDDLFTFGAIENEARWFFSGRVTKLDSPVSRQVYVYRRDNGELIGSTTSSGDGNYYLETTYSGHQFIVALDNYAEDAYNLIGLDRMVPVTIS